MEKMLFRWSIALMFLSLFAFGSPSLEEAEVIYLPETHDNPKDHKFQEEFIKRLYQEGYRFVLAMEMFQQPFQKHLDDYIACKISEEEMLERTEYRKRWGFPTEYYSPLWRFAKEKGIRIYALNIPSELVRRISKDGLENVKDDLLPPKVYEHTPQEKERLREVLKEHPKVDEKRFFDVQSAWDNGMALRIVRILSENKSAKVVVILGRGHAPDLNSGVPRVVQLLRRGTKQLIMENPSSSQWTSPEIAHPPTPPSFQIANRERSCSP
jgi:uncharacterized iron-regulated protein